MKLLFIVLVVILSVTAENATTSPTSVFKPTTTTTPQPNFISNIASIGDNIRKFFFSKFFRDFCCLISMTKGLHQRNRVKAEAAD